VRLRSSLLTLLGAYPNAYLAYEEVRRHLGTDAAHLFGALTSAVQEACVLMGVPYMGIPVGTIKKVATGKGNARKKLLQAAADARWPVNGYHYEEDEADGIWTSEALRVEIGCAAAAMEEIG